jgi:hypothetical protein
MYVWIWQHLPFGRWGKIIGSAVLISAVTALLWFVVFPWAEPVLVPFDDVQVGTEVPGDGGEPAGPGVSPTADEHEVPYPTDSNNPAPTASR